MWSHYARNHTGYCLEYNFRELNDEQLLKNLLFPVVYKREFYTRLHDVQDFSRINPYLFLYFFIVKSKDWKYEREWRLVDIKSQISNMNQPKVYMKPKAIFIGAKTPKLDKEKLIELEYEKDLKIYQMRMRENAFELYAELVNPRG